MIKYIQRIFNSNYFTLQNLLLIAIIAIIYHIYKHKYQEEVSAANIEGFTQLEPFVLKRDQDVYDEVYGEMYDTLTNSSSRSKWEIENVLKMTDVDKTNSVFLDVGSGSGVKVNELQKKGYTAYGVDKSPAMIEIAEKQFPEMVTKKGDVFDPMLFDRSTFTHILCMNYTIYEFKDKLQFFKNCYFWMLPNSYLVLHLVEPQLFNAVVPISKNEWVPDKKDKDKRITDTLVDFFDFTPLNNSIRTADEFSTKLPVTDLNIAPQRGVDSKLHWYNYHARYHFPTEKDDNQVIFTQTITDKKTKNIRQNVQILYMDNIDDILNMANRAGFVFNSKTDMIDLNGDKNQYLYILQRTL